MGDKALLEYVFPADSDVEACEVAEELQILPALSNADVTIVDLEVFNEQNTAAPYLGRRGAVCGDCVPADPTYWCSPQKQVFQKNDDIVEILRNEVLNQHPWFCHYAPFIKTLLEESFERKAFESNDVVSSPDDDNRFFFVVEGSVELLSPEALIARRQSPRAAAFLGKHARRRFRKGEDFGREGLLHMADDSRFHYTAVALLPSILLTLRRSIFQKIMMVNHLEPHDFLANTINYVRVFDSFSNAERSRIAEVVEPVEFSAGEVVLGEGVLAEQLYIIQEGIVEVKKRLPSGLHTQVKLLVPSECVGDVEIFSWDAKSVYDYAAYTQVKALQLPQDFLYEFHGNPLLKHLFDRINLTDVRNRKRLVDEILRKEAYTLIDPSDTDSEDDVHSNDELDSDDEAMMSIKTPEVTQFLLDVFFTKSGYNDSDAAQRGITLTAFSAPLHLPAEQIVFRSEPAIVEGESERVVCARRLRRRAEKPCFDDAQHLYVVLHGTVELLNRDGARIASIAPGQSFGEQRLLKKVKAANEITAVVVSPEGCDVLRLPRRLFRKNLMMPLANDYEVFNNLFSSLPFSAAFRESYLLIMQQLTHKLELGPASILLAEGVDPQNVFIVCSGKVQMRSTRRNDEVYLAEHGDVIGGLEVMDGIESLASFTVIEKAVIIRIPADQFMSVFRPGLPFVDSLRGTSRFSIYRSTRS